MRRRKILFGLLLLIAVGLVVLQRIGPRSIDAGRNQVVSSAEHPVSEQARKLHRDLIGVDLHADSLLWARDPAERHEWGHVDLPRLAEGNVALTVTSIDHVALGSDFDGSEPAPFDASGLPQLTAALLDEGFSAEEVRKIMGQNTLRVLAQVLR